MRAHLPDEYPEIDALEARVNAARAVVATSDGRLPDEVRVHIEQCHALIVDAENVARPKYVTLGPVIDGLRVVSGLAPDDNVVVNGLMRARPGVKVTPQRSDINSASVVDRQTGVN